MQTGKSTTQSPLRTILVTGASGFIGQAVIKELLRAGHRVIGTATNVRHDLPCGPNLSWVAWDAKEEPLPLVDWSHVNVVVHLAAPAALFDFPKQAEAMYELGIAATFRLLEVARKEGLDRFLAASSGDVLGSRDRPACEQDVDYQPSSFYGAVKASAELLVRSYEGYLSTAVLRPYHPYGPGGDRFLINRLYQMVRAGREVSIEGKDGITLNPVWIEDLARGVRLAAESDHPGIFHFAGPETRSLREVLEIMAQVAGRKPRIRVEPKEPIQRHAGSFHITRSVLGYCPQIELREGLSRLSGSTVGASRQTILSPS